VVITSSSTGHLRDKMKIDGLSGVGMGVSKNYDGLGALPAVPKELHEIIKDPDSPSGVIPGTLILDDSFTETSMAGALNKHYSVVHIASHFVLRPGSENNSYLLLGGKDVGGQGYHLTLAELRDNPALTFAGVDLVTLSGCDTAAIAADTDGREIDGLGFTAQQKGAKAVIASLWDVPDDSTGLLMADFYRRWLLTPGASKAEALRQAQLHMMRNASKVHGPHAHPYYWSPFVMIGNWN
jgi:CHAT domain-containing protein